MNRVDYRSHNWLAMRINNRVFKENKRYIKGRVIDMGCGDCQYKKDILEIADEYIGVDWEKSQHTCCEVDVFTDLSNCLPFPDDYADTIICFQVLEHLAEPAKFLRECFRVLSPQGHLIVNVPFMWGIHEEPHDYYRYTKYGLFHLLNNAGFTDIEVRENAYFWSSFVLRFNYHSCRYARGVMRSLFVPIWFIGQAVVMILDKVDINKADVASYSAVASKP